MVQINEYDRPGWDSTVLAGHSLYGVSKWHQVGFEALFVGVGLVVLATALALKRTAPRYRLQIHLQQG